MRTAVGLIQTLINHGRLTEADAAIDATRELFDRESTATWSGDIALIRGDNATALGHYAESLQIASRDGDIIQVINDSTCMAVSMLRAGRKDAGLEVAGVADALAQDAGHGGFVGWLAGLGLGETIEDARESADAAGEAAFSRGRATPELERVPRILALAAASR